MPPRCAGAGPPLLCACAGLREVWARGWCRKALYALLMSLGSGILCHTFVTHVRRYAWKTRRVGHCGSARNVAWWAPYWAMMFICVGVMYTMVMVARTRRRVPVHVSVRGYEWPLLIAMVVRQDGVCVMWREELQLAPNAGAHGGGEAVLCKYLSRAGIAGCLCFLDTYGCHFADFGLVVMEVCRVFGVGCVGQGTGVVPAVAPVDHHGLVGEEYWPASVVVGGRCWCRACRGFARLRAWYGTAALSSASMRYPRWCVDGRSLLASSGSWARHPFSLFGSTLF